MVALCAVAEVQSIEFCPPIENTANSFSDTLDIFHSLFSATATRTNSRALEPPQKKRRLTANTSVGVHTSTSSNILNSITLACITIDLHFQDENTRRPHTWVEHDKPLEVSLETFTRISTDLFTLSVFVPQPTVQDSSLLFSATTSTLESIAPHIDTARAFSRRLQRKTALGTADSAFSQCRIYPPAEERACFRLEIEIRWKVGVSVFDKRGPRAAKTNEELGLLTTYFPRSSSDETSAWSLQDFYENVHVPPMNRDVSPRIQSGLLDCKLYPFQKRAVDWLLRREGVFLDGENPVPCSTAENKNSIPASFIAGKDATGRTCYVSHTRGMAVTDLSTIPDSHRSLRGGILAEEMGLGKTVELIALMCLHPRKLHADRIFDIYSGTSVTPSGATLIITPTSILEQWKSEIRTHAPHLKVLHYKGIPIELAAKAKGKDISVEDLVQYDVVLTTYNVLSREIHFANPAPERSFRHSKRYEPRRSPLVQISWWRVCLDEAQMIESGVSQAATVARLIPRCNAWAVSGTPLRKDVQDLRGLLIFLRYEPYCSSKAVWDRVDKSTFKQIFGLIAMRHTKEKIREELRLPPQKRVVITVPFTAIEEQNYTELMRQMCETCGLSPDGSPVTDDWNPNDPWIIEKMREWLVRLRQTCLHAQVGRKNRKALGRKDGPLRTVEQVLEVMIEQNDAALKAEERDVILAQLGRGHIVANVKNDEHRSEKALEIYLAALIEATRFVQDCRNELRIEREKTGSPANSLNDPFTLPEDGNDSDMDKDPDNVARISGLSKSLRSALELEHACKFFVATSFFQMKSNENLTKSESEEFHRLEKLETEFYDKAKVIRRELLHESQSRAQRQMQKISASVTAKSFAKVPLIGELEDYGGIENRKILDMMDQVSDILNKQTTQLNEWHKKVVDILLLPLVDEDEGRDTTGDEYQDSTKAQDELYVYMAALRAIVADRNLAVTGLGSDLIEHEMKMAKRQAEIGEGHAPELLLKTLDVREKLKPSGNHGSLKGVISAVRSLATSLQWQADGGNERSRAELMIVERELKEIQEISSAQTKTLAQLERELELFRTTMNQRLEFYRQLQHISDTVAPWKDELDEDLDQNALEQQQAKEQSATVRLATFKTKQRFLLSLRNENSQAGERICVICQSDFELGVLTVCGHQYCKECIRRWWLQHRTCPMCKRRLHQADFHDITYKPQDMKAQEETHQSESPDQPSSPTSHSSIYSDISGEIMNEIKAIDLDGSYGTKIDTIARHILWIRENDPGAKSIVFSQFNDFLDVLRDAFQHFKIGCSSIGDKKGIERFRKDPSAECFLLDAKSDSSGLNLVNATYVFLCEPLINPAIELQAIARVHRIGQQRPTTVYMYLISETVEEAIYEISVSRRLEHIGRRQLVSAGESRSGTASPELQEKAIDAANSLELQQAPVKQLLRKKGDGEEVRQDDIWNCLFSKPRRRQPAVSSALEKEVGRHLRAEAAGQRAVESAN
ncbi:hypothetical protein K432DRAFT_378900 [Lepidopterella palustris CBS 459.81]|uniref:Uncharacterized protein n=1 Tax=Lepidopterella palustris CBS 459.81 TaxID=1314670 RepID=A0A8E2JIY8_9PEZI|nr:hypothetical protein K432DRAFT_378900 [Lepidopterella palustris CBS 459.81]